MLDNRFKSFGTTTSTKVTGIFFKSYINSRLAFRLDFLSVPLEYMAETALCRESFIFYKLKLSWSRLQKMRNARNHPGILFQTNLQFGSVNLPSEDFAIPFQVSKIQRDSHKGLHILPQEMESRRTKY
jgi:hypothetical protein